MFGRRKIASALIASLLTGLVALQAPSVSPVGANGGGWQAMGTGTSGGTRGQVMDIAVANNGMVYIGGWFNSAGGAPNTGYVAQWNPTTSAWSGLSSGGVTGPQELYGVCAVELDNPANPQRLYVGGDFGQMGPATTINSAYWSFSGGGSWSALTQGSRVREACPEEIVAVTPNDIYFAGSNLLGSNYFSYYNVTTSSFSGVAGGFSGRVFGLTTDGVNLYATGQFATTANPPLQVNGVAKSPIASPLWTGIGSNPTTSAAPDCLSGANQKFCTEIAVSGSKIFVGGNFPKFQNNGVDVPGTANLAMWDGTAWTSIGSVSGTVEEVKVIGSGANAYLYIGGSFDCVGDRRMNNIARYKIADGTWEAVGDGTRAGVQIATNGAVRSIEPDHTGNAIYVGGSFTDAGGIAAADNIAKLTPMATTAGPCNPPSAETAPVLAFDGPNNFRFTNFGMVGKLPGYNNGQEGRLIEFAWDAPTGVDYYIYKVSGVKITKKDDRGRILESEPLPSYDCWSVGLTCAIVVSKDDPYYQDNQNFVFTLRGFTFSGVGKPSYLYYLSPYDPIYPADPPTNVQAVAGWGQVKVSWDPPAYTGTYQITNYLVTATPGNRVCITTLADVKLTECTFTTALTPGTRYTFKVQALNGAGWSDRSQASTTPVSPQTINITKFTRNRVRFLFVNRGSDIVAEGLAPGYPAGTSLTAWAKYGDSTQWQPLGDVKISAFGTFSWKRRFPTNQDRTPISITFTQGNNQGNVVKLAAVR